METRENLTRENTSKIITTKNDDRERERERERPITQLWAQDNTEKCTKREMTYGMYSGGDAQEVTRL